MYGSPYPPDFKKPDKNPQHRRLQLKDYTITSEENARCPVKVFS